MMGMKGAGLMSDVGMLLKVGAGERVEGMTIVGYCWSIKEAATLLPVTDKLPTSVAQGTWPALYSIVTH